MRFGKGDEQRIFETSIPKAAIEYLDKTVLNRFAGLNVMPFETGLMIPIENRHNGQFGAVVEYQFSLLAT